MKIIKINWLSKDALEAKLTLSDGLFIIIGFAQPFTGKLSETLKQPIIILNPTELKKIEKQSYSFSNKGNFWGYQIDGKLINKVKGIIRVGNFELELDTPALIPQDIMEGDFITFFGERLDVI